MNLPQEGERLIRLSKKLKMSLTNRIKSLKKIAAIILSALIILFGNPLSLALAQTAPSAPSAPVAPSAPSAPVAPSSPSETIAPASSTTQTSSTAPTSPSAPTPPPEPSPPPPAPTAPPAPTYEQWTNSKNTTGSSSSGNGEASTANTGSGGNTGSLSSSSSGTSSGTGGQTSDSGAGASIKTGSSTNSAGITNNANSNQSSSSADASCSTCSGGIKVVNSENGSDSTNSGSVNLADDNKSLQTNSAVVVNNLSQITVTGDNSASRNTGGDNTIVTGDANTSGTIVNGLNTNLDGVMVYEFNIADDHNGDYILDFSTANCVSGCAGKNLTAANIGNGSDSTNTSSIDSLTNNNSFQSNDATLENNMTLASNSGDNDANRNTNGNNSITTGDANVAGSVLNFANNNIEGGVVYAVVNVFGNLVGDIIFPDGTIWKCCAGNINAVNSGNGSNSTNNLTVDTTTDNNLAQFNNATIENNLVFTATTGGNETKDNTSGNNSITTGESNILARAVNFVNNNVVGGDWWLVIINEGGKWIGKILGAPDGANVSGSEGFEFTVNDAGEIIVTNSGNGTGSTNNATVTQNNSNNIVQTNNAHIVNNVNLSANTGGNSASRNTGGSNSITTGDANIIANIVNFVNNNVVGTGRLFVTVVNVFGSWLGDFVGPGHQKAGNTSSNNSSSASGLGGSSNTASQQSRSKESLSDFDTQAGEVGEVSFSASTSIGKVSSAVLGFVQGESNTGSGHSGLGVSFNETPVSAKKVVHINLAYIVLLIPLGFIYIATRKKELLARLLPKRKVSLG